MSPSSFRKTTPCVDHLLAGPILSFKECGHFQSPVSLRVSEAWGLGNGCFSGCQGNRTGPCPGSATHKLHYLGVMSLRVAWTSSSAAGERDSLRGVRSNHCTQGCVVSSTDPGTRQPLLASGETRTGRECGGLQGPRQRFQNPGVLIQRFSKKTWWGWEQSHSDQGSKPCLGVGPGSRESREPACLSLMRKCK